MLDVNVFYHDTVHGLLTSDMNNQAVTQMHAMLLKHFVESICESASYGDIKSEIHSRNSSAPDPFVRAGNDNVSDVGTGGYDRDAGTGGLWSWFKTWVTG